LLSLEVLVSNALNKLIEILLTTIGAFWLGFAATLQPFYNAWGAYASDPTKPTEGLSSPTFYASFGFFFLAMALMCFVYLICSIRTNVAFFIIFLTLTIAFSCLTGAYWQVANGNASLAGTLQKTAGAFTFVTSASGWWIFIAQMLAALDFPFQLPGSH
jgi:succinate-acetate transporter protein